MGIILFDEGIIQLSPWSTPMTSTDGCDSIRLGALALVII